MLDVPGDSVLADVKSGDLESQLRLILSSVFGDTLPNSMGSKSISSFVASLMQPMAANESLALQRLEEARVALETSICCDALRSSDAETLIEEKLTEVHSSMRRIASKRKPSIKELKTFWALDGDFHGLWADYTSLSIGRSIIAEIQRHTSSWGQPSTKQDLNDTLEEHSSIIRAARSRDLDGIRLAIKQHVALSFRRWKFRRRMEAQLMNPLAPDLAQQFAETVRAYQDEFDCELSIEERDAIRWEIEFRATYPNEYVAFQSIESVVDGERRLVREIVAHSPSFAEIAELTKRMSNSDRRRTRIHHFAS